MSLRLARTLEEWSDALTASLAGSQNSQEAVEARRAVARQHDWSRLVVPIARSICEMMGPADLRRFDALSSVALP